MKTMWLLLMWSCTIYSCEPKQEKECYWKPAVLVETREICHASPGTYRHYKCIPIRVSTDAPAQ